MLRKVISKGNIFKHINFDRVRKETPTGDRTLYEAFTNRLKIDPNGEFLGSIVDGELCYETNLQVSNKITKLANFLRTILKCGEFIGIYSINRPEWTITEYAGYLANNPNVPLYSTFQSEAILHVLKETEMKAIVASADKARSLFDNVLGDYHYSPVSDSASEDSGSDASEGNYRVGLQHLILMDDDASVEQSYESRGIMVHKLSDIFRGMAMDEEHGARDPCVSSDVATICYTSGTSGMPKGVILTHENFISHMSGFCHAATENDLPRLNTDTVYMSYLPLAHVFERICFSMAVMRSSKIAYFRGDVKLLQSDYSIIKPTFVAAVPRVLNIFEERILKEVSQKGFLVRLIFKIAMKYKKWRQKSGVFETPIVDRFVFNKVADKFGGRLDFCLCGGSSISPETLSFVQAALCMRIFQGYGQTEGLAANIVQPLEYIDSNTVGVPFPSTQIMLEPVDGYPENSGEVLMRGPSITSGYYRQPELTKKAFVYIEGEKWLKTGDIAKFDNDRFYIVGRVKEMFKTSYGEYISPEHLENCFVGGIIDDIFVCAHPYSDSLIAIIHSEDKSITKKAVLSILRERGDRLVKEKKINKYEIPGHVIITVAPFNELDDGNLVTPSFKKRRLRILEYFAKEIEEARTG